ncbi:2-oxoglutarate-dependent dioxygenase-related family protein [Cocos nucifera]|uniref:2-oxoglutarate-dependent dioxygenase-related family protein n=1 Tax=Cocos nucifera TaxID=13894 RepID=A0A8K0IFL7_COCNU|nr:2-oxoglutarate-dependent dioxygenase-related family protein [Cocos nucifera]
MASKTLSQVPRLDLSDEGLQPGSDSWGLVRAQVRQALETFGCFEAVFPKVPEELRRAIFPALEELFSLPTESKLRNISDKPNHGYVGQYPHLPLFESMGIEDADIPKEAQEFTAIMWPHGNQSFSETICSFSKRVKELDQMVRRMVLESLGVEKYLDSHMQLTHYVLRVMKYKGPDTTEATMGLGAHSDSNVVTILYQNQDGLEIQTKDGRWIPVSTSPDSFVVMAGDSFTAWSNGRVHAPEHRVMMTGSEVRYSAGLFAMPKAGQLVGAPVELVDEEHPLLYKPFDHVEFLRFHRTRLNQSVKAALNEFRGA